MIRIAKSAQPLSDAWKSLAVAPRDRTSLGVSFRPLQVEAFGLEPKATLAAMVAYPFELVRLAAYWNRIERRPNVYDTGDLDWQVQAAERAGKKVILSVGALKNFGYPEFFVPAHRLERPLPEGRLVTPSSNADLLSAASQFITGVVERYRHHDSVTAWQLEHESVDPLGVEHSWRLSADFVRAELAALKAADATRPVLMNGFLPTSSLVRLSQGWQTRDQGDSLAVAAQMADIVGIDYYPRHALLALGARTVYLDGRRSRPEPAARIVGKRLMVSEGQAEPWEAVTVPPNLANAVMFSCRPEDVIANYNAAMAWAQAGVSIEAYLFWGAEYWVLRSRSGDSSYLQAFSRILEEA